MKKFVCSVCGYVYEGEEAPEFCPVCKAPREKFNEVTSEMAWADEHRIGVAKGVEEDIVEDLRANFMGECTEVGMYLAMSRQADREGYPEVGEAYKRIAYEEAEREICRAAGRSCCRRYQGKPARPRGSGVWRNRGQA